MIATVVTPQMMPPLATNNTDSTITTTHGNGHTIHTYTLPTRNSADKAKFSGEYADRLRADAPMINGKPANGTVMQSIPHRPAPQQQEKRASQPEANGAAQQRRSARSQSPSKATGPRPNPGEFSGRDDGYFASVYSSEVQDGCTSTHVKLGALSPSPSDTTKDARKEFPPPNKVPTDPLQPQTPQQSNLQVPGSTHRVSSPPAFNHNSPSPSADHPYRLQHRHTLEVPSVSAARARGLSNTTDDVVTASGRFSPNTPTRRRGSMSLARRATRSIHSDMHLEEVPQDEDAARWAEHIRQKRASKRKRKEDEDDDRVVVGTKVDQNHVNWVTAYNMLTGIRFTVSRTNAKMDRDLTDADFEAKHKFSFDMYDSDKPWF